MGANAEAESACWATKRVKSWFAIFMVDVVVVVVNVVNVVNAVAAR